jgi:hypothetical protein
MICASVCLLRLISVPLSFVTIVFGNGRILGVRSPPRSKLAFDLSHLPSRTCHEGDGITRTHAFQVRSRIPLFERTTCDSPLCRQLRFWIFKVWQAVKCGRLVAECIAVARAVSIVNEEPSLPDEVIMVPGERLFHFCSRKLSAILPCQFSSSTNLQCFIPDSINRSRTRSETTMQ